MLDAEAEYAEPRAGQNLQATEAGGLQAEATAGADALRRRGCPPYPDPLSSHPFRKAAEKCEAELRDGGATTAADCKLETWSPSAR